MRYPQVLDERSTIKRAKAQSLARLGDGELRIALGGASASQRPDANLARELRVILSGASNTLVCVPHLFPGMPYWAFWEKYTAAKFTNLMTGPEYGSTFVTRPDCCAVGVDAPDYWQSVRSLWEGKDIVYAGDATASPNLADAKSLRHVGAPRQNAYEQVDAIEGEIGNPSGTVLLCMGATATVLAHRLAAKNIHAIDIGHIGWFMQHQGAYAYQTSDLISAEYRAAQVEMHANPAGYGGDGKKQAATVMEFAKELEVKSILDYGCGEGTLAKTLAKLGWPHRVAEFDPGIRGREEMPKPVSLVACTDVLEHIEPDKLDNVLRHIYALAGKGAYFVIATRLANKTLPDGRNAHIIVEQPDWWLKRIEAVGFKVLRDERTGGTPEARKEYKLWLLK